MPPKIRENILVTIVKLGHFGGMNHVKFGNFVNFSCKNHVKFGHFVTFSIFLHVFGQKCKVD